MWPAAPGDHRSSGIQGYPGYWQSAMLLFPLQPANARVVFWGHWRPAVDSNVARREVIQKTAGHFRSGHSSQEDQGDKYIFDVNFS